MGEIIGRFVAEMWAFLREVGWRCQPGIEMPGYERKVH
jgi:hypothetical protein